MHCPDHQSDITIKLLQKEISFSLELQRCLNIYDICQPMYQKLNVQSFYLKNKVACTNHYGLF